MSKTLYMINMCNKRVKKKLFLQIIINKCSFFSFLVHTIICSSLGKGSHCIEFNIHSIDIDSFNFYPEKFTLDAKSCEKSKISTCGFIF